MSKTVNSLADFVTSILRNVFLSVSNIRIYNQDKTKGYPNRYPSIFFFQYAFVCARAVRVQWPVSRTPRKLFGPVKPFIFNQYLKTERCIRPKRFV